MNVGTFFRSVNKRRLVLPKRKRSAKCNSSRKQRERIGQPVPKIPARGIVRKAENSLLRKSRCLPYKNTLCLDIPKKTPILFRSSLC